MHQTKSDFYFVLFAYTIAIALLSCCLTALTYNLSTRSTAITGAVFSSVFILVTLPFLVLYPTINDNE